MFTAYTRLEQNGIEALEKYETPIKSQEGGHWYFDDFRIALQYYFNKTERTSGVGILAFAPNGNLWCETAIYCDQLNELAGYYYGIDRALEEAKKSKAKAVQIFIPNKHVVKILNLANPFKEKAYAEIHNYIKKKLKIFLSVEIRFRKKYPSDVQERLDRESKNASLPPEISLHGHVSSKINLVYFNIMMVEEDKKLFAEQYARLYLDFIEGYMKEYEQDYGKEALIDLHKGIKEGKIKDLPPTKRNIKENIESKVIKVKETPFKKVILCQNCNTQMIFESATFEMPQNEKHYRMRCKECFATKTLNDKGKLLLYGRYSKKSN
jgi:hypothetical protein